MTEDYSELEAEVMAESETNVVEMQQNSRGTFQAIFDPTSGYSATKKADLFAAWLVDKISMPFAFAGSFLGQFYDLKGRGIPLLGFVVFMGGTLVSADGIWQVFFHGIPLFPWFEEEWVGWANWGRVIIDPVFWISFSISAIVQWVEAGTLRSKTFSKAKADLDQAMEHELPEKPQKDRHLDIARVYWRSYKRAGMKDRKVRGGIAALFWGLDFVATFSSRNPFTFIASPGSFLGCIAINLLTMGAGEIGYNIFKLSLSAHRED